MLINLTLYTTKLSPTDTIYFASKQAQDNYFNSLQQIGYYANLTYNGLRNIRLTGTVPYLLTTSPANYARIEYLDVDGSVKSKHYCFIDNIVYRNDNCYEIELTIDYIQTFLHSPITVYGDYAVVAENRNFSTPLRRSYGNVLPVAIMGEKTLYSPRQSYRNFEFVYAVLTVKSKDDDEYNPNLNTGLASYVLPAIIMRTDQSGAIADSPLMLAVLRYTYHKNASGAWEEVYVTNFLESAEIQGNFVGLTVVDDIGLKKGFTISPNQPSESWNDADSIYIQVDLTDAYNSKVYFPQAMADAYRNSSSGLTYSTRPVGDKPAGLPFFTASPARELSLRYERSKPFHVLQREPYSWLELRQRGQQAQRISFTDNKAFWGEGEEIPGDQDLFRLKYVFNPLYPNTTTYYLFDTGSLNEVFTVEPAVSNLAFSVDQWAQYYVSNKASVNDGLATKHSYDMEIANRTLGTQVASAGLNMATGLASAVATRNVAKGISAVTGATSQLVGSVTAYANTKTNIEKENALLELSYQNLKSAPSTVNNQTLNQNSFASIPSGGFKIVLVSPNYDEYNTISRYHTVYGFKLEEYTNTDVKYGASNVSLSEFLKPSGDSSLNSYRYFCAKDVKLQNGLKNVCQIISGIFENGLKIWGDASYLETSKYPYEQYARDTLPLTQLSLFRS